MDKPDKAIMARDLWQIWNGESAMTANGKRRLAANRKHFVLTARRTGVSVSTGTPTRPQRKIIIEMLPTKRDNSPTRGQRIMHSPRE